MVCTITNYTAGYNFKLEQEDANLYQSFQNKMNIIEEQVRFIKKFVQKKNDEEEKARLAAEEAKRNEAKKFDGSKKAEHVI